MLTAYATLDATIEAIRERIYDFFPKPVKIDELKKSVKKALGKLMGIRSSEETKISI